MFDSLKKIFHNPKKETINIFEKKTKINYEPTLFNCLEVLSLNDCKLSYLEPLSVFTNLKILNLSNNNIQDISYLKNLTKLKIVDFRFNNIKNIPSWVFKENLPIYWERIDDKEEGIYLEGNPLDEKLILEIRNYPKKDSLILSLVEEKENSSLEPIEIEQLIPLKREAITLIVPESYSSNFISSFEIYNPNSEFKVNISKIIYNDKSTILDGIFYEIQYIILLLKENACCLHPPILDLVSKHYPKSQIFLIIENNDNDMIQEKITFFKTYNKSINIIEIYHSFDKKSNDFINKKIYDYLGKTQESNSLWKKSWIALRDKIEDNKMSNISFKEFESLANEQNISSKIHKDIFIYLQRIGSIMKSPSLTTP